MKYTIKPALHFYNESHVDKYVEYLRRHGGISFQANHGM